ncbi:MAG TPA: glycosyltransferase [Bacteroidales bacterium]|nr:glycosyltransferase [Bacteroidales bacterium]
MMGLYVLIIILPYVLFILYVTRQLKNIKTFTPVIKGTNYISVIIACRNEEARLSPLLKSLSAQNYPSECFEVILVDDNSTDNTLAIASSFSKAINLKIITNKGSGKKEALLAGIKAASGELIMTTDADCRVSEKWISTAASFFGQFNPAMIISPVWLQQTKGYFGRFQELEFLSLQGITAGMTMSGNPIICNGANLAFTRKDYLNNVKNIRFDIATGDDVFLLHSMKKEQLKILWLESSYSCVETEASPGIKPFLQQRRRWASKGTAYKDFSSIFIGIITLAASIVQSCLLIASIFYNELFSLFLAAFILKSIPDYLLLNNTSKRYGRTELLKWFIPSQVVYPFYVLVVAVMAFIPSLHVYKSKLLSLKNKISYPFQKETLPEQV